MTKAQQLVLRILYEVGRSTYTTQLVKLVYFVDYIHYRHRGRTCTGLTYMWDLYGPNAVSNQIVREADELARKNQVLVESMQNVFGGISCLYRPSEDAPCPTFDALTEAIIKDVVSQHGHRTAIGIANASKRTLPFRKAQPGDVLSLDQPDPFEEYADTGERAEEAELVAAGEGKPLREIKSKYGLV
jgi:hypothetical protein